MKLSHDPGARERTLSAVQPYLDDIELFGNRVLVAVYEAPAEAKTKGGIILTESSKEENIWQGKTGLVIKVGPWAFKDRDGVLWSDKEFVEVGDWVSFHIGETRMFRLGGEHHCRVLTDRAVMAKIRAQDVVY
jgi:co-chaperonin GroES (HSP10)